MAAEVHLLARGEDDEDTPEQMRRLLPKARVAELLSVSERTLDRIVQDGALPACRIRGQVRFRPADVAAFIEASLG